MMRWKSCCARAARNSAPAPGFRTARRARKNPKAACGSNSCPSSSRRATSRRPSRIWSRASGATTAPGAARRHRLGQDLHHGQGDRGDPAAGPGARAQQDARRAALWRVQAILSRQRGRVFRLAITTTTSRKPICRAPTPISRRNPRSTSRSTACAIRRRRALLERDDVIVVASVSCIYGIGDVETYSAMTFTVKQGERIEQRRLLADLVALHYKRNDSTFVRGTFRVRGDTVEIFPSHYEDRAWRIAAVRRRDRERSPSSIR